MIKYKYIVLYYQSLQNYNRSFVSAIVKNNEDYKKKIYSHIYEAALDFYCPDISDEEKKEDPIYYNSEEFQKDREEDERYLSNVREIISNNLEVGKYIDLGFCVFTLVGFISDVEIDLTKSPIYILMHGGGLSWKGFGITLYVKQISSEEIISKYLSFGKVFTTSNVL